MNLSLDPLLDRLADGECDGEERRQLLLRLEAEPDGWRRCALSFLEAQEWRGACGVITRAAVDTATVAAKKTTQRRSAVAWALGLAAGLLVAFASGWLVRHRFADDAPLGAVQEVARSAPLPAENERPEAVKADPPVDPVVRHWEERGFVVERQQRVIGVQLRDGRKVQVPVQEVRLRDVRGRTF
jgi:hypothetical protein